MSLVTYLEGVDSDLIAGAARHLFGASFANAWEESGRSFGPGTEIMDSVPDPLPETFATRAETITRQWLEQCGCAWGVPVAQVINAMSSSSRDHISILYYLCMGCLGHGVGLWDDWDDALEHASTCSPKRLDPSPTYLDSWRMDDLAQEYVDTL